MSIYIFVDGISQVLSIVLFLNGCWQILSISAIYIFCATTGLFVDSCNHNIKDATTQPLGLFTLSQQHADVEKRTKIKESQDSSFGSDINVARKT